ncbi:MAG: HIT family protein [Lachnospiraceae bacterium]|nr:HIT family protein [Lachnospiraceae bacterium]
MKDENCIFCKIADGRIPSNTLYEDENFRVILDIAPAAKGHAIAIAKRHCSDLFSADPATMEGALPAIARVAEAMKKALSCDGINILQNNGEAAGQSVFHLHFHILPRRENDGFTIPWQTLSYNDGEAEALAAAIRAELEA